MSVGFETGISNIATEMIAAMREQETFVGMVNVVVNAISQFDNIEDIKELGKYNVLQQGYIEEGDSALIDSAKNLLNTAKHFIDAQDVVQNLEAMAENLTFKKEGGFVALFGGEVRFMQETKQAGAANHQFGEAMQEFLGYKKYTDRSAFVLNDVRVGVRIDDFGIDVIASSKDLGIAVIEDLIGGSVSNARRSDRSYAFVPGNGDEPEYNPYAPPKAPLGK